MALDYEGLIESYRHPRHKGRIAGATHSRASNASCGDNVELYILVDSGGKVKDAKYDGSGCVISMATAEAVCGYAIGKNLRTVCSLDYDAVIRLLGFTPSAGRIGCVMVVLGSLKGICEKGIKKRCHK